MGEWIFVRDELPPELENVIVYVERNVFRHGKATRKKAIEIGWHYGGFWHVDGCSGVIGIAWMNLPKPPKINKALNRGD